MNSKSKYVEIPPNAARTLAALRELGYDSMSAICDLVDNSIDAEASRIDITVRIIGKTHIIEICDNGLGMTQAKLQESLRLGSDVEGRDETKDLGKYGMGLVTASLSIAQTIYVMTREKGKPGYEATFDVATVERHNKWVLELRPAASKAVLDTVGDYGTLVRLTNVDRLDDTNVTRINQRLHARIGRVFRNYIQDGVEIRVNKKLVDAVDPLMRDKGAVTHLDQPVDLGKGRVVRMTIVELPDLGPHEDEKAGILPNLSGFYIVRNRREIASAQTFGFYKHHHSYSHFRAELVFGGDLDDDFHVDVKKTSITPNDQILEKLERVARKFWERSGRVGHKSAIEKTTLKYALPAAMKGEATDGQEFTESDHGSSDNLFLLRQQDGHTVVDYNKRHVLFQLVADTRMRKVTQVFVTLCTALAEAVQDSAEKDRLIARFNEHLTRVLNGGGTQGDTFFQRWKS